MARPTLSLTAQEALLRSCLLDCAVRIPSKPDLRFTGGWVRDKLLSIQSHDIDVALSTMTGITFAEQLKFFMDQHGQKYQDEARRIGVSADLGSLHQIAANPEKSKHLETVTTKMFDLDLDFVNLRKETYTEQSRNPHMEFGTAEEDSLRRDATVNALFYNLHTEEVEDFTQRGLDDMKSKIIRTPLEPYQTFEDDPLRVLRLIRFACRLDFRIDESTQKAMGKESIHQALRTKISRERVWTEVGKMFSGPDPCRGSILIHDLGLYQSVFGDPALPTGLDSTGSHFTIGTKPIVYKTLNELESKHRSLYDYLHIQNDTELNWLLAAYSIHGGSDAASPTLQNALKPAKKHLDILRSSAKNFASIKASLPKSSTGFAARTRAQWGMHIYQLGDTWQSQYLYAMLHEVGACDEEPERILSRYEAFLRELEEHALLDAAATKPIVNGEELKEALGGARPGKWMSTANRWLLEWQFGHPGYGKEDALKMMLGRQEVLVKEYGMVCTK